MCIMCNSCKNYSRTSVAKHGLGLSLQSFWMTCCEVPFCRVLAAADVGECSTVSFCFVMICLGG